MADSTDSHSPLSKLFSFFKLCSKLKHLKRTGWVHHGVNDPETIAGHMYRMAMMAFMFTGKDGIDREKCIKLALVHDLAESIVGDLTPSCNVSKEEKHKRERDAMEDIVKLLDDETVGQEMLSLWKEYEFVTSSEAVVVHDLDKFDMIFQAYEYETDQGRPGELQQFFDSTKDIFKTSTVQYWAQELDKLRSNNTTTNDPTS